MEAVYLARQAGWETAVIDQDPGAPARALAEEFHHINLLTNRRRARSVFKEFDLVVPATENHDVLVWLNENVPFMDIPLALDLNSYNISCSKAKSNRLFALSGILMPEPWPECGFPVIVKPSNMSGSAGVEKVVDHSYLTALLNRLGKDVVIQKFLDGPSYSLEVIADRGRCTPLQVTELKFDAGYDCKRVIAGPGTGRKVEKEFLALGSRITSAINLSGIMDIEVIETEGTLKVLEIDARLPSQTPSAVYHSTGINMIEMLGNYWINGRLPEKRLFTGMRRAVIYEHLRFRHGKLAVAGEHVITGAQGLKVYKGEFSADVMISNYEHSPDDWVATTIYTGKTEADTWEVRNKAIDKILQDFRVRKYSDTNPFEEGVPGYDQVVL